MAGFVLIDKFKIIRKIGEGTFGEVHLARDLDSKKLVGLKRIFIHNKKDGFPIPALREIKILLELKNENIVQLLELAGTEESYLENGFICFVFPYFKHDLCAILKKRIALPLSYKKYCIQAVLRAVQCAHSKGVLHRDIKTSNVFLTEEGNVFLADFGLSRFKTDCESQKYTPGVFTCWYRPPEILLGERRYTQAADMWAVGCLIAEVFKEEVFLKGRSEIDQLGLIEKACGSINEKTFPGVSSLPNYNTFHFKECTAQLSDFLEDVDKDALSLIESLLCLSPQKRLSASEALQHRYFNEEPLAEVFDKIKEVSSSHEYEVNLNIEKKRKKKVKFN